MGSLGGTAEYQQVQSIFNKSCVGCHSQPSSSNRNVALSNYQQIIDSDVMIAGNAMSSRLYQVIDDGSMPQNLPALPIEELDAIRSWIDAGAPDENGVPANEIPIVNLGNDRSVVLPVGSTVDITIVASINDPDGNVIRTFWTLVNGPDNPNMTGIRSNTLTVQGIDTGGVYVFEILVEDDLGAIVREQITVTVTAPNQGPNVNIAQGSQTITLPTTTVSLTGTANDPDGTIINTQWTRVSGPGNPTIVSPGNLTTNVTNLQQGTYVFRLTATDDEGATGSDTTQVIVSSGTPPTITLNANFNAAYGDASANITSTITDDGTVNSISWTRVSGPSNVTFSNGNTANPTVSGFVSGTYVLRVSATDDLGNTSTRDTNLNVIVSYATDVEPVLSSSCMGCHNDTTATSGLSVESHASLIASNKFTPGSIAGPPVLLQRINLNEGDTGFMPKDGTKLDSNTIKLITDWIAQGAQNN